MSQTDRMRPRQDPSGLPRVSARHSSSSPCARIFRPLATAGCRAERGRRARRPVRESPALDVRGIRSSQSSGRPTRRPERAGGHRSHRALAFGHQSGHSGGPGRRSRRGGAWCSGCPDDQIHSESRRTRRAWHAPRANPAAPPSPSSGSDGMYEPKRRPRNRALLPVSGWVLAIGRMAPGRSRGSSLARSRPPGRR